MEFLSFHPFVHLLIFLSRVCAHSVLVQFKSGVKSDSLCHPSHHQYVVFNMEAQFTEVKLPQCRTGIQKLYVHEACKFVFLYLWTFLNALTVSVDIFERLDS